jgi:transposase
MPDQPLYRSQVLDHLGLVAGMCDDLGIGDVIDHATQQHPEMRDLTTGEAVKAMVLNGRGLINHALDLVPRFFQNTPTYRLIAPGVTPDPLHDAALGRALDTLYADGVTARYRLLAATAAARFGLTPRVTHLDSTSFHVDGRDNGDAEPEEQVMHLTRGYSRDHRPDLHQGMWELSVEPQAGIPRLRQPLSGHSRDVHECGQVSRTHLEPWHTTYGVTYIVAESALDRAATLQKLAQTAMQWLTRVPATLRAAQAAVAQVDPQALASLQEGDRSHALTSTDGGMAPRWGLIYSEPRQPQAQRTVDRQRRQQRAADVQAVKKFCRSTLACEAEARPALAIVERDVPATCLRARWLRATPRYGTRGRPRPGSQPEPLVDQLDGALAASLTTRPTRIDQQRCCILATNALDTAQLPPPAVLAGSRGQVHVARGCRLLKDPQFFASALSLKKPERMMALLMVMTVCLLVYAALEYRIRNALTDHEATCPDQRGTRIQQPTARWVVHDFVGIHVLCQAGQWPMVLNRTEEHQHVLRLLGKPSMQVYDVRYS